MKVAYMIGSLHPGGTEHLLLDVFRKASEAPFEMLLVHRKDGELLPEFPQEKTRWLKTNGNYLWRLRKMLKQEQVTVVHAQHWLDCVYARLATIGLRMPIVLTFHGYFLRKGWKALPIRMAIRMADKVGFVSESEMEFYEEYYRDLLSSKATVIYNGVNFEKIKGESQRSKVEGLKSEMKLCFVGSFGGVRSQEVVAKALVGLKAKDEGQKEMVEFYFIGGAGSNGTKLKDECKAICAGMENVHFLGNRNDVPELLSQMDGFVYSSRRDTFGIAIVEAMASGLPVVVNDYPVMCEISLSPLNPLSPVEKGDLSKSSTLFYRSTDVEDCRAKIEDLIANIETYKERARENAVLVREKYSIENHIKRLEEVYESIGIR